MALIDRIQCRRQSVQVCPVPMPMFQGSSIQIYGDVHQEKNEFQFSSISTVIFYFIARLHLAKYMDFFCKLNRLAKIPQF